MEAKFSCKFKDTLVFRINAALMESVKEIEKKKLIKNNFYPIFKSRTSVPTSPAFHCKCQSFALTPAAELFNYTAHKRLTRASKCQNQVFHIQSGQKLLTRLTHFCTHTQCFSRFPIRAPHYTPVMQLFNFSCCFYDAALVVQWSAAAFTVQ